MVPDNQQQQTPNEADEEREPSNDDNEETESDSEEENSYEADEEHSDEESSDSESEEEGGTGRGTALMVAPKKAKSGECGSTLVVLEGVKPASEKKKTPKSKKFCDEDEIAVLKRLAAFWAKGRNNKWSEFHRIVKDELRDEFSRIQVSEKIRSLKKKFETNLERASANGGCLHFSNPHESIVFKLSQVLWGDEDAADLNDDENEEANQMSLSSSRKRKHDGEGGGDNLKEEEVEEEARKGKQLVVDHDGEGQKWKQPDEEEIRKEDFESAYPLLYASFHMSGFPEYAKKYCVLIPREKAQELEEKWRELSVDVCDLEIRKLDLIRRDLENSLPRKRI